MHFIEVKTNVLFLVKQTLHLVLQSGKLCPQRRSVIQAVLLCKASDTKVKGRVMQENAENKTKQKLMIPLTFRKLF